MTDLSGIWSLADERGDYALSAAVPGDVHSALQAAGLIPDPYVGRNEYGVRWVADRDWTLARSFEDTGGPRLLLVDGLDTVAEVRLNGAVVLRAESAFLGHLAEVDDGPGREPHRGGAALRHPPRERAPGVAALPGPLPGRQLPDPQRQHAAQAAVRLRLGLGHRPRPHRHHRPHRPGRGGDRRRADPPAPRRRRGRRRDRRPSPPHRRRLEGLALRCRGTRKRRPRCARRSRSRRRSSGGRGATGRSPSTTSS